jgi:molybdenum cofactor cytidylyltransferase
MLSIIILAAGKSERMGKTKLLLPFGGKTILGKTAENYARSGAGDEMIVVFGARAGELRACIDEKGINSVINPDYASGMSSTLKVGLRAASLKTDAVLFAMGDQPFIPPAVIRKLADEFFANEKGIAFPTYQGQRGQPTIFSIKYREKLLALTGDTGARELIERHANDVLKVPVDTDAILIDIDTEEAYQEALQRLNN